MNNTALYDRDFYAWIEHHVGLLKAGRLDEVNTDILIDELESMAKRDRRELISHLIILLAHLLKWEFQLKQLSEIYQEFNGKSWRSTLLEQRMQIAEQLDMSPSLKGFLAEALERAYPKAVSLVQKESGLARSVFPKACPYTLEQVLDEDFYPES